MYSVAQLRRGLARARSNPGYLGRELNRLFHRRLYRREYNTAGVDVMAADWDVLLLLDACRYDTFRERARLPGRLDARVSRGSHTTEFLRGNFAGRQFDDTVYVTASPQFERNRDALGTGFHAVVNVWDQRGWDGEYGTVMPETTAAYAREADDQYPDKRLLVHFMQPHYPFIGADSRLNARGMDEAGEGYDVWGLLMRGDLEAEPGLVERAYRDNLDAVLPHVEDLMDELRGKVVVTSDHGNMFGERARPVPVREWGHPPGVFTSELVRVPWLVHEGDRRPVEAEPSEAHDPVGSGVVADRLEKLGYT